MKKSLSILVMALVLFTGACKKDSAEKEQGGATTGSWKIGDKTFKIAYSGVTMVNGKYNIIFSEKTPAAGEFNFLTIIFKAEPTVGTYKLISMENNAPIVNANECQVGASNNTTLGYGYIGTGTVNVVVEKVGGKLKVTVPEITVQESHSKVDYKLSATAMEI